DGETRDLAVTPTDFVFWRENQRSFEGLGAFVETAISLAEPGQPAERRLGIRVDRASFDLLRARPALGRLFTQAEDETGAAPVIVLSHRLWSARFGADSTLIGRSILVSGIPTTVLGVMPEGFGFPIAEDFWVPLRLDEAAAVPGVGRLDVFGRLRPGVSFEAMEGEFASLGAVLEESFPAANRGVRPQPSTFRSEYLGDDFVRRVGLLVAASALVLLVACMNVMNLLVVQASGRAGDFALQRALGADERTLTLAALADAAVLAVPATFFGVGLSKLGIQAFEAAARAGVLQLPHGPDALFWWDFKLGLVPLLFVVGVATLTVMVTGILPLRMSRKQQPAAALGDGARGTPSRGAHRLGRVMVVAQLAVTAALLVSSGLMVKSLYNLQEVGNGIEHPDALIASISVPAADYPDNASVELLLRQILERASEHPAIVSASLSNAVPGDRAAPAQFQIEGQAFGGAEVGHALVSAEFFDVVGGSVEEGRALTREDIAGSEPVAVVSREFANLHFPPGRAVGARLKLGPQDGEEPWTRIVGVAPNLWMNGVPAREAGVVFLPFGQWQSPVPSLRVGRLGLRSMSLTIQTSASEATTIVPELRQLVSEIDPNLPISNIRTLNDQLRNRTGRYRVWGAFYTIFGAVALFLASLGLYGVMASTVAARRGEIGVRLALGGGSRQVAGAVLKDGLMAIGLGVVLGSGLAIWMGAGIASLTYEVDPLDLPVLLGVIGVLVIAGVLATAVPAIRATRISPAEALRS
ncbi:MAG: putative ABC transport system permease protein, partial [Myxococcota bacterium]